MYLDRQFLGFKADDITINSCIRTYYCLDSMILNL